jgi:hypothetical protein
MLRCWYIARLVASTIHIASVSEQAELALNIYRGLLREVILTFCVLKYMGYKKQA